MDKRVREGNNKKLVIFCAGNLGKEIYDIAKRINEVEQLWSDIFFADNYPSGDFFYDVRVYKFMDLENHMKDLEFVIANGEPATRKEIYKQLLETGGRIVNLIDPTAIISPTARLGKGVIVTPFSTISSDAEIKDNVLVQSYVRVGHDISIGKHSVISANVAIGGATKIGQGVFIGMGASILEELSVGDESIVGMGAVLYNNIDNKRTAIGNPARVTKGKEDGKVFR